MATDSQGASELAEDVATLRRIVAEQAERIEALEAELGTAEAESETQPSVTDWVSRRSVIQALGLAGLAGYGTRAATADPQGQVGTGTDPLQALHTEELNGGITGGTALTDLTGTGLSISSGSLTASGAAAWADSSSSNDLLEPTSGPKGLEVDQLSEDPDITDDMGALYASGSGATGNAGDVVVGSDAGGTTKRTVLFDHESGAIPGGSLTASSVTASELASGAVTPSEVDGSGGDCRSGAHDGW